MEFIAFLFHVAAVAAREGSMTEYKLVVVGGKSRLSSYARVGPLGQPHVHLI